MLDDLKFITNKDPKDVLGEIERRWRDNDHLSMFAASWRADNPTNDNLAKQVAEYMAGKSIVVYGDDKERVDAWRENIALIAHNIVFGRIIDGDDKAEREMWHSHPPQKLFAVIILKEGTKADSIFDEMSRELSGRWPQPMTIEIPELEGEFSTDWAHFLAEMSATYLAILNGVKPQIN